MSLTHFHQPEIMIKVGPRLVGPGAPALLVAEIGGNHGGDPLLAGEMVKAAAEAGAGAVKFQAYQTEHFLSRLSPCYQELAGEELPFPALARLLGQARRLGLAAGLTVFDQAGLHLAREAGADFIKISSGDLSNHPLLELAAGLDKALFISTGASDEAEVEAVLELLAPTRERLVLMQCASLYPAPPEAANLAVIGRWLARGLAAGYSDHVSGLRAAQVAAALGAVVLEKHFTIDRDLPGGDNLISALPEELAELSAWIAEAALLRGSGLKSPHPDELLVRPLIRRAWSAARPLPAGRRLEKDDLVLLRPPAVCEGPVPADGPRLPGRVLVRELAEGAPLSWNDLEGGRLG
ncbi:MAG: N-acetylneuraminate synthase family protein [Candidatus Adiutrix sp.]|jgi:sialic acid synthase SpsE|nr:N-acetylneuraminate synthase family protein [Candidatus Adiutrix sp.]